MKKLKREGYRILVSDIHESSKSIHDIDWTDGKTAIIMGNEEQGCSQTVKDLCDDRFYIPMKGINVNPNFKPNLNSNSFPDLYTDADFTSKSKSQC
jgi:tRNA(Leu) C34 or U34 (ribose-2'-O)-methylase TrmL